MIKAEPKTILHFTYNYFDVIHDLFEVQSKEGMIRKEAFAQILIKHEKDIRPQLFEYKILKSNYGDYELRDVYYKLIEFILFEFRPLLPEEVQKFGSAITALFKKIKEDGDRNILAERLKGLSVQIKEFSEAVEKNSIRLLSETRELKANVYKIDYIEKIQKAAFWIKYYIIPLNTILDINDAKSISNKLLEISHYVNQKRLNFNDETLRQSFEKLYNQLVLTNDELLHQSKILTHELLPLIERIRTESLIITGFIEFLKNPYKVTPPKLLKTDKDSPYSGKIYLNTKEYFEQFMSIVDAIIEEDASQRERWIFNKSHYKKKLLQNLPVENFFDWCKEQLKTDTGEVTNEKFFAMTGLLFENDLDVNFSTKSEIVKIETQTAILHVPKLNIKRHAIS